MGEQKYNSRPCYDVRGWKFFPYELTPEGHKKLNNEFYCYLLGRGETRTFTECNRALNSIKEEDLEKEFPVMEGK